MIVVPPRYYCIITNPVLRDEDGQPLADQHGQIRLRYQANSMTTSIVCPNTS